MIFTDLAFILNCDSCAIKLTVLVIKKIIQNIDNKIFKSIQGGNSKIMKFYFRPYRFWGQRLMSKWLKLTQLSKIPFSGCCFLIETGLEMEIFFFCAIRRKKNQSKLILGPTEGVTKNKPLFRILLLNYTYTITHF